MSDYRCQIPVVLIIFNRPLETAKVIESIKKARPVKMIIIADGPRNGHSTDAENVLRTRQIINDIDWDCEVVKIFRDRNFGCMKSVVFGINKVFELNDRAIIIEDDCKPSLNFFKFMEWGLDRYQYEDRIGMISGSNLIADKMEGKFRNGFSMYINIWGWATWKDKWEIHNSFLSLREINIKCDQILSTKGFNFWQRSYWKELFKFTVYCSDTWDFQLQYTFFKHNLLSVYPRVNLIENIGFNGNSTHTNINKPLFVKNNIPDDMEELMNLPENSNIMESRERDLLLANVIWYFHPYSALKLKVKNILFGNNFMK